MATTPVFLPGKSHAQRNLVGNSPRGCKRDMTDQLNNRNRFDEHAEHLFFYIF